MQKLIFSLLCIALFLSACNSSAPEAKKEEHSVKPSEALSITPDKLAVKWDPTCQMNMEQSPIADTLTYKGNLYGFCHPGCKEEFKADPEKYLAALPK